MKIEITVELPEGGEERLDRYVANAELLTRGQIKARNLQAFNKNSSMKLSKKVKNGMVISLEWEDEPTMDLIPEAMDLDILYEDQQVVVVNKRTGMVVHPALGNWTGTLVQGLLHHNRNCSQDLVLSEGRPGIVHRLDKDTSGVIITARNTAALEFLSEQFRERETDKTYLAVIRGCPIAPVGDIQGYIARDPKNRKKFTLNPSHGKWSLSHYRVMKRWKDYSLVEIDIETGRTHQIRVHMTSLGCPVVGDSIYSRKDSRLGDISLMLHSWKLAIQLPGQQEKKQFEAPMPKHMTTFIEFLDQNQRL
ncbi:MAG: RluA family pseudouridine synthase [Spirochaetaceae bacterium]|jgi:23S rRNA pseudouridine1911/1915/1917 synthase|nr:RluA family pseudouridine synthase [Spirochaetaceae bacterium]